MALLVRVWRSGLVAFTHDCTKKHPPFQAWREEPCFRLVIASLIGKWVLTCLPVTLATHGTPFCGSGFGALVCLLGATAEHGIP